VVLAGGVNSPLGLVVNAKYVYWLDQPSSGAATTVTRVPVNGGGTTLVGRGATSLATDGTTTFWAIPSDPESDPPTGAIFLDPPRADGGHAVDNGFFDPTAVTVGGQYAYWADQRSNQIMRAKSDNSEPGKPIATGMKSVRTLKVDGATLFGVSDSARSLFSVPVTGGGITRLGSLAGPLQYLSLAIALDPTHVYAWFEDSKVGFHLEQLDRTTLAQTRELVTTQSTVGLATPLEYANNRVYFVSDDGVYRISTTQGGTPELVVKSTTGVVTAMAIYGGALYWAEMSVSTPSSASVRKLAIF
jgi:hypothetical protein